ncbi:RES family NAD+ phosphorylase [Leifsonia virtsii]|uniref:RES family NAD+ phosphorylase n=3 Tax=Leifsonia TaxID=110932 RepID=A0ABT8J3Z1_9MICO|nr:RES family NAD+ phosphorylase [Leifsonia virtsii]MDN4599312.1 RES family NAD+ phosphorylase [Leifsonia virtsii]
MMGLAIAEVSEQVWRVGYRPDPWAWADWRYANDAGRFNGRWDDQLAELFRTLYTGESLLACLLEVLAQFRPEPQTDAELDEIEDEAGEVELYPDAPSGTVGYGWLEERFGGKADQTGRYCSVTHSESLAAIQANFPFARFKLTPIQLDTSVLKDARRRDLTRSIARWIFELRDENQNDLVDGIQFTSRFGDEYRMWAIFERAADGVTSGHLTNEETFELHPETPELVDAFRLHNLRWKD